MAQDLGSALLAGFQAAQAMGQQRFNNEMALDELDLARRRANREDKQLVINQQSEARQQSESDLKQIRAEGDELFGAAYRQGWYDPSNKERPFDPAKLKADLSGSDPERKAFARDWLIRAANHERKYGMWETGTLTRESRDFRFNALDDQAFANGQILVRGNYISTGEPGVSTVDGSNNKDDKVLVRDFQDVANDLSVYFSTTVLQRGSNLGATSPYTQSLIATDVANADARQGVKKLESDVVNATAPIFGPELGRAAKRQTIGILGAAKDPAEKVSILIEMANGLNARGANIQIPSVFTNAASQTADLKEVEPPAQAQRQVLVPYSDRRYDDLAALFIGRDRDISLAGSTQPDQVKSFDNQIKRLKAKADALPVDDPKRLELERAIAETQSKRNNLVKSRNDRGWRALTTELENLKREREKMAADRRAPIDSKIAALELRRERFIQAGYKTPELLNEGYKELEKNVLSKIEGMSPTDLTAAIDSGALQFTQQDVAAMRAYATQFGIRRSSDIRRLPNREQIALRALMYAVESDPSRQQAIYQDMVNLSTTGIASMSVKDLDASNRAWADIRIRDRQLSLEEQQFLDKLRTRSIDEIRDGANKAAGFVSEFQGFVFNGVGGTTGRAIDDKGSGRGLTKERVVNANRLVLAPMILETRARLATGGGSEMLQALNSTMSTSIAALAKEGDGSFLSWVASFFRPDSGDIVGAGTDFSLSRVLPDFGIDDNGNPTIKGFWYTTKNGAKAGVYFTAQQVQEELDPEIYETLAEVVLLNRDASARR